MNILNNQKVKIIVKNTLDNIVYKESINAQQIYHIGTSLFINGEEVISIDFSTTTAGDDLNRVDLLIRKTAATPIFSSNPEHKEFCPNPPEDSDFKKEIAIILLNKIKNLPEKHFKGEKELVLEINLEEIRDDVLKKLKSPVKISKTYSYGIRVRR